MERASSLEDKSARPQGSVLQEGEEIDDISKNKAACRKAREKTDAIASWRPSIGACEQTDLVLGGEKKKKAHSSAGQ